MTFKIGRFSGSWVWKTHRGRGPREQSRGGAPSKRAANSERVGKQTQVLDCFDLLKSEHLDKSTIKDPEIRLWTKNRMKVCKIQSMLFTKSPLSVVL